MAKKQGGSRLDLATRRPENEAINAAVRCAASLFIPRLRPLYKEAGIEIPADATVIQWLPTMKRPKPAAKRDELAMAWAELVSKRRWYNEQRRKSKAFREAEKKRVAKWKKKNREEYLQRQREDTFKRYWLKRAAERRSSRSPSSPSRMRAKARK